jgi:hypothetical protein
MKETKAHTLQSTPDREEQPADTSRSEIRLLDDFELVLAGGGEGDVDWP